MNRWDPEERALIGLWVGFMLGLAVLRLAA